MPEIKRRVKTVKKNVKDVSISDNYVTVYFQKEVTLVLKLLIILRIKQRITLVV